MPALAATQHALQSANVIGYKHKQFIQRNRKNLLRIEVQPQTTPYFLFWTSGLSTVMASLVLCYPEMGLR